MVAAAKNRRLVSKLDRLLPTDRQAEILASIVHITDSLGRTPSLQEIADECKIKSLNGVAAQLMALRRKGWVSWAPNSARSLVVTSGVLFLGDVQ